MVAAMEVGGLGAHRELEKPHVPVSLRDVVESEAVESNKCIGLLLISAIVAAIRKREAEKVESQSSQADIQENLQDDVLRILRSHGTNRELQQSN
jgi:hypothetical protein